MGKRRILQDRYEIRGRLGEGGMATVYDGYDLVGKYPVAVKHLKGDLLSASSNSLERFDRESEILRRLNHPNIVKIYSAFTLGKENFVIMELVTGGDLAKLLDEKKQLPIDQALQIALDLADALTRAHRLNVIHRDIKPANVLLAEDGTPRLSDFGVAHLGDSARITKTGTMIGTLAYLSPEACMGEDVDARADIWSFGVMLYEMITGFRPFMDSSSAAILTAILSRPVPPIEKLRPDCPPELAYLISTMLEKEREDRISSIRRVGAAIEAIMNGEAIGSLTDHDTGNVYRSELQQDMADMPASPPPEDNPLPQSSMSKLQSAVQEYQRTPPDSQELDSDTMTPDSVSVSGQAQTPLSTASVEVPTQPKRRGSLWVALAVILLAVVGGGAFVVMNNPASTIVIDPVPEGEYMILVSAFELLGGTDTDPSRFIYDDLKRTFEDITSASPVHIRQYPEPITSAEQATQIAETYGATGVVWGNYDGSVAEIKLQLGADHLSDTSPYTVDQLRGLTDVTLRSDDLRSDSLVFNIAALMNVIHSANGEPLGVALNLALAETNTQPRPDVLGSTVSSYWHNYIDNYFSDPAMALENVGEAIALDSNTVIPNLARSLTYVFVRDLNAAREDITTARARSPENFTLPDFSEAQIDVFFDENPSGALPLLIEATEFDPDNWYLLYLRGMTQYLLGNYGAAKADITRAMELSDDTNLPYIFATGIALREGNLEEASRLIKEVRQKFPDPRFGERLVAATYDLQRDESALLATLNAFGNFSLLQWSAVVESAQLAIDTGEYPNFTDPYLLKGFAECNLGRYADAEASYTRLIELDPEYWVAYLLRAEVRTKQGNIISAGQDIAAVAGSPQADLFTPYIAAVTSGEISCENVLEVDIDNLQAVES